MICDWFLNSCQIDWYTRLWLSLLQIYKTDKQDYIIFTVTVSNLHYKIVFSFPSASEGDCDSNKLTFNDLRHLCCWLVVNCWYMNLIQGGVTPMDSIVTAATAGQNFDRLFSAVWPLTMLIFGLWPLTARIFYPQRNLDISTATQVREPVC